MATKSVLLLLEFCHKIRINQYQINYKNAMKFNQTILAFQIFKCNNKTFSLKKPLIFQKFLSKSFFTSN